MEPTEPPTITPVIGSDYVTVVSVGTTAEAPKYEEDSKDYVTVLKIGNDEPCVEPTTEEVLVYRLPGEKLGFGLKFEGGTKSAELVKRLFIQSCAVNSPASRVQSSWGPLSEGDEILEIDSVPVNTMTRIDCVRYLKDSNVVIKLLIKHRSDQPLSKFVEDLPLVISAEKKKMQAPPPPPPVPPRKVNRKSKEIAIVIPPKGFGDNSEPPVPLARQNCHENNLKNRQSPYNSMRKLRQSPEVIKKVRKLSDDGSCPPDAEVYIDLFSQESAYSLSESDDTGSSISTVVDRFGSYPTTTTSSFAGSLPSTPTPVQKHIDVSDEIDFSSDYLYSKLVTSQCEDDIEENLEKDVFPKQVETNPTLQPPANFQDAPLSYGNEDVKILKTIYNAIDEDPPSPPPRIKIGDKKKSLEEETLNIQNLPRLVDFVPKSSPIRQISNSIEIVKHFLENEKSSDYIIIDDNDNHIDNSWCEDSEFYSLEWNHSSKLATIGEDEEETAQDEFVSANIENPVVIIENADTSPLDESGGICASDYDDDKENDLEADMDIPPIYSRQPPDGHESPDYKEVAAEEVPLVKHLSEKPPPVKPRDIWKTKDDPPKNNVRSKIAIFSTELPTLAKKYVSTDNITLCDSESNLDLHKSTSELSLDMHDPPKLYRMSTMLYPYQSAKTQSNLDLSAPKEERHFPKLSSRSFSLSDVSGRQDKLSMMVEQRKKCLSRLKELVIPENIPEIDSGVQPFVDLPEIKSDINVATFAPPLEDKIFKSDVQPDFKFNRASISSPTEFLREKKRTPMQRPYSYSASTTSPSQTYPSLLRKLQKVKSIDPSPPEVLDVYNHTKPVDLSNLTVSVTQNDPPKSLESITSPTRSDYSFEYIYSGDTKKTPHEFTEKVAQKLGNLEDESDNDSALSSSQSSYISKNSPPNSPTNMTSSILERKADISGGIYDSLNRRLLKPQSVEAINRKNILASARISSGKDLKVGSPLIQRKFDDDENQSVQTINQTPNITNQTLAEKSEMAENLEIVPKSVMAEKLEMVPNTEMAEKVEMLPKPEISEKRKPVLISTLNVEVISTPKVQVVSTPNKKPNVEESLDVQFKAVEPVVVKTEAKTDAKTEKVQHVVHKQVIPEPKATEEVQLRPKATHQSKIGIKHNMRVSKAASVNDLRKNFEKEAPRPSPRSSISISSNFAIEPKAAKRISLPHLPLVSTTPKKEDHPTSIDSKKIKEVVLAEYDNTIPENTLKIVILKPDVSGGSIGITLAGGADYETKEITIHKIRDGSPAHRDGRLQKGDRILMVNGKTMKGLSHSQSLKILKENVPDVTIAACTMTENSLPSPVTKSPKKHSIDKTPVVAEKTEVETLKKCEELKVSILKDAAGLGFSIQGGQDSPQGNMPLTIKKLFVGGAADKSSQLLPGDEIIAINETDTRPLTRIEVWNLMKKLPNAVAVIHIRRFR